MRTPTDTSFANITDKFARNIYATSKGRLRLAILARDLAPYVEQAKTRPLRVLDVGAGLGQVNVWFAQQGCQVTHSDVAAEMVSAAKEAHSTAGLTHNYRYICAGLQDLPEQLQDETFDLVICHAVLEWLHDPAAAMAVLKQFMAPNALLSLMFYNRDAKLFANTIYGNFDYVQSELQVKKRVRLSPQQPIAPADVTRWLSDHQLDVIEKTGVRCFHDYLREPAKHQNLPELLELELKYSRQAPFQALGRYQHWLIKQR